MQNLEHLVENISFEEKFRHDLYKRLFRRFNKARCFQFFDNSLNFSKRVDTMNHTQSMKIASTLKFKLGHCVDDGSIETQMNLLADAIFAIVQRAIKNCFDFEGACTLAINVIDTYEYEHE